MRVGAGYGVWGYRAETEGMCSDEGLVILGKRPGHAKVIWDGGLMERGVYVRWTTCGRRLLGNV